MTYQTDGIQFTTLDRLPLDLDSVDAARIAMQTFAESEDIAKAQDELNAQAIATEFESFTLRNGRLMVGIVPKRFLVQRICTEIDAVGRQLTRYVSDIAQRNLRLYRSSLWVTLVPPTHLRRIMSQKWHRDPYEVSAKHSLKLFWYLSDVDDGSGPFEYIRGSHEAEPPTGPGAEDRYISPALNGTLKRSPDRLVCTGPADTVIIANTSGVHRGGYCASRRRLSATLVYTDAPC